MPYLSQRKIKEYREENKPSRCPILNIKTDDWVVDHDHQTGFVRGVISRQANSLIGKIENFYLGMCKGEKRKLPTSLECISFYLKHSNTNQLHHVGLNQLTKRFKNRLTSEEQVDTLVDIGATKEELNECSNSNHRSKLFRKLTKTKYE